MTNPKTTGFPSIDQHLLSKVLGSEIVGEIYPKPDLINTHSLIARSRCPKQTWLDLFKTELIKLCGFIIRPGAVKPEVWCEILRLLMYTDTKRHQ